MFKKLSDEKSNLKFRESLNEYDDLAVSPLSIEIDEYFMDDDMYNDDEFDDPNIAYRQQIDDLIKLTGALNKLPTSLKVDLINELRKINPEVVNLIKLI